MKYSTEGLFCVLANNKPFFTVAQSIQNIVVTERQLGVGSNGVGPTPNGQSCEDGKNSFKNGAPRKKPRSNNKPSLNCAPGSEIGQPSDIPLDQATLFRILSGQLPNPALPHNPQMASFLKQYKGVLNGTFLFLVYS